MNNLGDYLNKRAQQLSLDRAEDLAIIQEQLDVWYPGKARAQKLHEGKLTVTTTSSSVASELRFKQAQIKELLPEMKKVIIR